MLAEAPEAVPEKLGRMSSLKSQSSSNVANDTDHNVGDVAMPLDRGR
jgi:hypothetical protein